MRLLHTMLRVGDLQRSIAFYTNVLGMKLLRTSENPEYKYSLAFVGYGPETEEAVIELTYNWGVESYDMGNAYGHIALSVDNAAEACERIRQNGGNVTREAGPVKGGSTIIAFVEDPDGYKIELIEAKDAGRGLGKLIPRRAQVTAPVVLLHPGVKFAIIRAAFFRIKRLRCPITLNFPVCATVFVVFILSSSTLKLQDLTLKPMRCSKSPPSR